MTSCARLADLPPAPAGMSGWPWTVESAPLPATRPDGSAWPRLAIVTPSLNQARFLEATIRSVLLQGYPSLDYRIVDGGSSDGSVDIIRKYQAWLSCWSSEADRGQSDAINKGFQATTGDILGWLNSDDFLAPEALAKVVAGFAAGTAADVGLPVGALVGAADKRDGAGEVKYAVRPGVIARDSLLYWWRGQNFLQPACFFTREAWRHAGPLRLDLDYAMDLALWLKMSERFAFRVIDDTLASVTLHEDAKTVAASHLMIGEIALVLASEPDGFASGKELLFWFLRQGEIVDASRPGVGGRWRERLARLFPGARR